MERTGKIIRIAIYAFLKDFQYFTTTPVLLMLPFSASVLLSQAFFPSSSPSLPFLIIHESLFHSAGFPSPSLLVSLFNLQNISQTIFAYFFTLPFILSFLVIGKASLYQALNHRIRVRYDTDPPRPFSSSISLYKPLLITHLWNLILNTTINMAAFNTIKAFRFFYNNPIFLVIIEAVFYTLLTNIVVVCKLALVVAGMENCSGYILALRKAFSFRRGTNSMAILLALPANFGLAAIEALFYYRIARAYNGRPSACLGLEGLFIAYLHSLLIILDTIAWCLFFKSCRSNCSTDQADGCCCCCCYDIVELGEEDDHSLVRLRTLEELP